LPTHKAKVGFDDEIIETLDAVKRQYLIHEAAGGCVAGGSLHGWQLLLKTNERKKNWSRRH
jgi:hypothetical protein